MPLVDILAIAAAIAGVTMAFAPGLQIRRMLERRSSADVSIAYLTVLLVGFGIWIGYGLALGNVALIVSNSVAMTVNAAAIAVAWRLRRAAAVPPRPEDSTPVG